MQAIRYLLVFAFLIAVLGGCRQQAPEPAIDMSEFQRDIQQKTEELFRIHLKLDTAVSEISAAEAAAREGNVSGAEFHASEAYRNLVLADEALLDLGRDLQALANLDVQDAQR